MYDPRRRIRIEDELILFSSHCDACLSLTKGIG